MSSLDFLNISCYNIYINENFKNAKTGRNYTMTELTKEAMRDLGVESFRHMNAIADAVIAPVMDYDNTIDFSRYLDKWVEAKFPLFQKMGGLKVARQVEETLSEKDIISEIKDFVNTEVFAIFVQEMNPYYRLPFTNFFEQLGVPDFKSNTLEKDFVFQTIKDERPIKINKGMKLSKSFKFFLGTKEDKKRESLKDALDKLQIAFSSVVERLTAAKRKLTIEVSIDPIDILAMSMNADNRWQSCHRIDGGEYSAGTIAYLVDKSTAIAQVITKETEKFAFNNKAWRRLVYFDNNLTTAVFSRSYPSANPIYTDNAVHIVGDILGEEYKYGFADSRSFDLDRLFCTDEGHLELEYNDIVQGAVSKLYFVSAEIEKLKLTGDNKSNDLFRNSDTQSALEEEVAFPVGYFGNSLFNPTGSFDFAYGCEGDSGAIYSESWVSEYYDDYDEDWD